MTATHEITDPLVIAGEPLHSRLLLGTGGFRSLDVMAAAIEASATALVTVALRRVEPSQRGSIVDVLDAAGVRLLPNTVVFLTEREALLIARRGRVTVWTTWVKVIGSGDERSLLPKPPALTDATQEIRVAGSTE